MTITQCFYIYNLEPVILFGEGKYSLSTVKEIVGTESFKKLDDDIKKCQNREDFEKCKSREYIKNGLENCKCTPYQLRNYSKKVS